MKVKLLLVAFALAAGPILAADSGAKDDLIAAAKKLAQDGYSWKTSFEQGNFSGTFEGKYDKEGLAHVTVNINDNSAEAFIKGEKVAVKLQDAEWQSMAELTGDGSDPRGRIANRIFRTVKHPAAQFEEAIGKAKDFSKDGVTYSADLSDAGAKALLGMGGRRGGNPPEVVNAKGSVRISLKDGVLAKAELRLQGTIKTDSGDERDISRTITTEIKNVGKTSVEIPDDAKKKLS